jgi:hypothetical protein
MIITEFVNQKKISRSEKATFLAATSNGELFILKKESPARGVVRKILRRIIGGSISFRTELLFYKSIHGRNTTNFRVPQLLETDGRGYMILQYIKGERIWDNDAIPCENLVSLLLEFQTMDIGFVRNRLERVVALLSENILLRIVYHAIRGIGGEWSFTVLFTILKVVLISYFRQKKCSLPVMLHNDLFGFNNIIRGHDGNIYLCDFESCTMEKRWVLRDAIDLSFGLPSLSVDNGFLNQYLSKLTQFYSECDNINLKTQMRVLLLRIILTAVFSNVHKDKDLYIKFMKDILLSDAQFEEWFHANVNVHRSHRLYYN